MGDLLTGQNAAWAVILIFVIEKLVKVIEALTGKVRNGKEPGQLACSLQVQQLLNRLVTVQEGQSRLLEQLVAEQARQREEQARQGRVLSVVAATVGIENEA